MDDGQIIHPAEIGWQMMKEFSRGFLKAIFYLQFGSFISGSIEV